ncbi:hypothetical protein Tco_0934756 [Tanacetum coccineum]
MHPASHRSLHCQVLDFQQGGSSDQELQKQRTSHGKQTTISLTKENPRVEIPEAIKLQETEEVTNEAVTITLRRAISFFSTIQAHDGHWPAESAGPLFFLPPMVISFTFESLIKDV